MAGRLTENAKDPRHKKRVEIRLDLSGQQLDELFDVWLFTPAKPKGLGADLAAVSASPPTARGLGSPPRSAWSR